MADNTNDKKPVLGNAGKKNSNNSKKKQVPANLEVRQLASSITRARKAARDWGEYESEAKERLFDITRGETNIEMVTESGDVVATVSESKPPVRMDWKAFREDHPDLDYSKYEITAEKGSVTLRTSWVEQTPDDK